MNNRYIGVFDSGVGGLTAVKELIRRLPGENIVYFGDTGRVPYGTRSEETILKYTRSDIRFLNTHDLKLIVVACGTVSAVAVPHIRGELAIPLLGVVEPTSLLACSTTKNGVVGIIGTNGTIKSGKYEATIHAINPNIQTVSAACPMFVPLAENNMANSEAAYLIAKDYLQVFLERGVDTLILGCTHYPLLAPTIRRVLGPGVSLVDAGAATASYVAQYLLENNLLADTTKNEQYKFYVSDSTSDFCKIADLFLGRRIDNLVKQVDIERY